MGIKFNEDDFISCSEFKCEQDYNDFVEAIQEMGYSVFDPDYVTDVLSRYTCMMFDGEDFTSAVRPNYLGKEYTLKDIMNTFLPQEAQSLRKILLQAVKDVENGRLTSVDEFLEKL